MRLANHLQLAVSRGNPQSEGIRVFPVLNAIGRAVKSDENDRAGTVQGGKRGAKTHGSASER